QARGSLRRSRLKARAGAHCEKAPPRVPFLCERLSGSQCRPSREGIQMKKSRPPAHPQRVALHNEMHARPPEAMSAPLAISHMVMVGDAQEREASRAHVAALLRDHHLPQPDANSTHIRMDVGAFRIRWELHTEFVTWSFSRAIEAA